MERDIRQEIGAGAEDTQRVHLSGEALSSAAETSSPLSELRGPSEEQARSDPSEESRLIPQPMAYTELFAFLRERTGGFNPLIMLRNIAQSFFFSKMLSGFRGYDYFARFSNGTTYGPRAQFVDSIRTELNAIYSWVSDLSQQDCRLNYVGVGAFMRYRNSSGQPRKGFVNNSRALALSALSYYRAKYVSDEEVSGELKNVGRFLERPSCDPQAFAWWLVGSMAFKPEGNGALVKALKEVLPMDMVASTLPPFIQMKDKTAVSLRVEASKEHPLLVEEELIPSFDFRVVLKEFNPNAPSRGFSAGFFEVKQIERLRSASDMSSAIRNVLTKKLKRPYRERDGGSSKLAEHPSLKILVVQAPWPTDTGKESWKVKGGQMTLKRDGKLSFQPGGNRRRIAKGNLLDLIADNLNSRDLTQSLDGVFLTDYKGHLLETYYHSATPVNGEVLLRKPDSEASELRWQRAYKAQINCLSYFCLSEPDRFERILAEMREVAGR